MTKQLIWYCYFEHGSQVFPRDDCYSPLSLVSNSKKKRNALSTIWVGCRTAITKYDCINLDSISGSGENTHFLSSFSFFFCFLFSNVLVDYTSF